jgi:DNA helicase II / ATP-dependent DNA helicase PcrA
VAPQLTDKQREVVYEKHGLFVVKACPGSGKTLTVAVRLSRLLNEWRNPHAGIAVMSFTNIAWQEVERYLAQSCDITVPLGYPHFLGTIDSFINRFIFLPFGHKVMGCGIRPELTGLPHDDYEPIGRWLYWRNAECNKYGCHLNDFSYNERRELMTLAAHSHFNKCQSGHEPCARLKAKFTTAGYATQADANYFALKLLEQLPELASAVSRRFPVLIIDEAQDSSSIQMRIVEILIRAGVKEVMFVGDPYQAIYEWRQAEPRLFEVKFNQWQDNCVWLSENWRSTQSICNLACRLANSAGRINAMNREIAYYDHVPLLYGYNSETELPGLLQAFREHCASHGIDGNAVSVLTRSREFINAVVPGTVPVFGLMPWRDDDAVTRQIAHSKYMFDGGDVRGALRRLEVAAYKNLTGKSNHRHEDVMTYARSRGMGKWRGLLFRLLCELPESKDLISAWLPGANRVVSSHYFFQNCTLQIKNDRQPNIYSALRFEEVFAPPTLKTETGITTMGTVHSVKGRSLDAVFLALKLKGATGPKYTNLFDSNLLETEELRIVYVAVTRARKALALAVPQTSIARWRAFLLSSDGS